MYTTPAVKSSRINLGTYTHFTNATKMEEHCLFVVDSNTYVGLIRMIQTATM